MTNLCNIFPVLLGRGLRASLMAALFLSCTSGDKTCSPPVRTMYSCQAIPTGSSGCVGGPPSAPSAGASPIDPDMTFPVGCVAQMPFCVPAYSSEVQTCTCQEVGPPDAGTAVSWSCPK